MLRPYLITGVHARGFGIGDWRTSTKRPGQLRWKCAAPVRYDGVRATRYIIIDGTPINFSMQSRPERYFISRQYVHIRVYRSRKRATTTPVDVYARHVYAKNWRPLLYTLLSSTRGLSPFSAGPQTVDNVATFDTVYTVPIVD